MSDRPIRAHTFIIRIRAEPREALDAPQLWRGTIQHLPSGTTGSIKSLQEALAFMEPYLEEQDA